MARVGFFSLFLLLLFALTGSGSFIEAASGPQKVVFSFAGVNERYGCLFVAKDHKFFEEQGLDAQIVQMRNGPLAILAKDGLRNALRILSRVDVKFSRLKVEDLVDDRITRRLERDRGN